MGTAGVSGHVAFLPGARSDKTKGFAVAKGAAKTHASEGAAKHGGDFR